MRLALGGVGALGKGANRRSWLILLLLKLLDREAIDRLQLADALHWVDDVHDALVYAQPRQREPTAVVAADGAVAVLRTAHRTYTFRLGDTLQFSSQSGWSTTCNVRRPTK